jgi:hypothetical protein
LVNTELNAINKHLKREKYKIVKLIGTTTSKDRQPLIDQYNNRLANTLLISSAADTGIDVHGTYKMYKMEPQWHVAGERQRSGRVGRRKSHAKLPKAEQKVDIELILKEKPAYIMKQNISGMHEKVKSSVDVYIYSMALKKQQVIDKTLKFLGLYVEEEEQNGDINKIVPNIKLIEDAEEDEEEDDDEEENKARKKKKEEEEEEEATEESKDYINWSYRKILKKANRSNKTLKLSDGLFKFTSRAAMDSPLRNTQFYITEMLRIKYMWSLIYINTPNLDDVYNMEDDDKELDTSGRRVFTKNDTHKFIEWTMIDDKVKVKATTGKSTDSKIIINRSTGKLADLEYNREENIWYVLRKKVNSKVYFTPYVKQTYSFVDVHQKMKIFHIEYLNKNISNDPNFYNNPENLIIKEQIFDAFVTEVNGSTGITVQFQSKISGVYSSKTFVFSSERDPFWGEWIFTINSTEVYQLSFLHIYGFIA